MVKEFQPPLQVLREGLSICMRRCVAVRVRACVCEHEGTHTHVDLWCLILRTLCVSSSTLTFVIVLLLPPVWKPSALQWGPNSLKASLSWYHLNNSSSRISIWGHSGGIPARKREARDFALNLHLHSKYTVFG